MLQPPSYHKLCHVICSGHTVTWPIDPYRSSLCSGLLLSSHSHSVTVVESRNQGLKTVWLSRLLSSLGACVQNTSILSSSCLSLTHFPNPPDLLGTQDVSLGHGFASLRCCFKFHVCNSKRQREMGNLSPQKPLPHPSKVEDAVGTGMQLPNKLRVTRKLLCQGISTESQSVLMCPIRSS